MAYINDTSLDALLNDIRNNVETLHICSQEPSTVTEAITTYSLGEKPSPTVNAPSDRSGGGREIVVAAISDGSCDANGTATHWALVKTTATARLLATGSLTAQQVVTSGNPFTLTSFAIGVPDAVSA